MKKTALFSILLLTLLYFFQCEGDDTGRIILNLPDSNVAKVHIAVFEGGIDMNNLLTKKSFKPHSIVSMEVPAGKNRVFLIVSEDYSGHAYQSAVSEPVDLDAGDSRDINVSMTLISVTITQSISNGPFNWNNVIGIDHFTILESSSGASGPFVPIEETEAISYQGVLNYSYKVRAYFYPFNLYKESNIHIQY